MFPLKLGSELQNLVKEFQFAMKIKTKYRSNFHQVENFHEVKCTPSPFPSESSVSVKESPEGVKIFMNQIPETSLSKIIFSN